MILANKNTQPPSVDLGFCTTKLRKLLKNVRLNIRKRGHRRLSMDIAQPPNTRI